MKRDFEIVKKVLGAVEESTAFRVDRLIVEDVDAESLAYHVYLCVDSGFLTGIDVSSYGSTVPQFIGLSMTSQGHDFLDMSRSSKAWAVMKEAAARAGGMSLSIAQAVLTEAVKQIAMGAIR